ncbi:hypothetical protein SYNPS1DRAFT_28460 [Syncephalis pseudoplumigaleata]|uniref:O-acyltransferase WSD1 C-terminal domain-containing protein n=1 Tax=Syncephalis pseudoplumigaleata TaxID=1712513 RepID=A0A4P9Z0A8_9FUNG|nr:hypothetical protein SYNPS1DRAFT_28460 [Syncephalis pseudoplumigaleata]|eukprot:RKP25814.1 hypothetical protein SYNPS1DRAFT_28460 [Syncephalis pseudoplumigaleata]
MPAPARVYSGVESDLRLRWPSKDVASSSAASVSDSNDIKEAAATTATSYMNPIDDLFLRITTPARNFGVASLFWVDGDVETSTMLALMERLVAHEPKFRQRCVRGTFFKTAQWVDVDAMAEHDRCGEQQQQQQRAWSLAYLLRVGSDIVSKLLGPGATSISFINRYMDNSHGIVTNVPGSPKQLYFANGADKHRITACIMYPPALFEGATGIAIASYNGEVRVGTITDDLPEYPGQARRIADGVYAAFQQMVLDARASLKQCQ